MHETDLQSIDLNLLKLLDALLRERSVTRAGQRLGLTQPAASRALGRLRTMLGDRVVVRTPKGLEFTPRALALEAPVARLLTQAASIVAPAVFDPARAQRRFTVATFDHLALTMIPPLVARLTRLAPHFDLEIPPSRGDNVELVTRGDADLALGVFNEETMPAGIYRRRLYDETMVCIVRRGHPALRGKFTAGRFAALAHVLVTIQGRGDGTIDTALARAGLQRRIALRLPHFLVGPSVVAQSDYVLTLPARLAKRAAASLPVSILKLPVDIPALTLSMIWHERVHDDAAHIWLREQMADVAHTID